jgi:hypothetical protein
MGTAVGNVFCGWCVGCEEVACGTRVEDGPPFDGFGADINRLEKD